MPEEERRKRENQGIDSRNNPVGSQYNQFGDDLRRLHSAQATRRDRMAQEEFRQRAAKKRIGRRIHKRKQTGATIIALTVLILLIFGANKVIMEIIHHMSLESGQPVAEICAGLLKAGPENEKTETELMGEETETELMGEETGTEPMEEEVSAEGTVADEATPDENAEENEDGYIGELPDIDIDSWEYVLVNADHTIGDYEPDLSVFRDVPMDTRILDAMESFVEDAEAEGLPVWISCAYRDYATQENLYQRKISQGYSEEKAATIVARPGYSEHQTGLAADITDVYRESKDAALEETATYQWMSEHCQEYGFVVRYPKGKEDITGIIYEPWHFRYVGIEAATFMMENNLCLEEFVALYQ